MIEKLINVKVITNAKRDQIEYLGKDSYKVKVTAPPIKGRANSRVVDIVSGYFKIKRRQVNIIQGEKNQNKLIYLKL